MNKKISSPSSFHEIAYHTEDGGHTNENGDETQETNSTPAYLGPVTSTYTVRNTERYPFNILPFGVTAMRAAVD